jgi:maltose alpha-D-glucosyltransferase/alpha-amylase
MPSYSDAWTVTIDEVGRYFELVLETRRRSGASPPVAQPLLDACHGAVAADLRELLEGFYQGLAELIGRRTGELHLALASRSEDVEFAPEPFSKLYQRSVYQSMRATARKVFSRLRTAMPALDADTREMAATLLATEHDVMKCLQILNEKPFSARKIRIHGDYHLARLLYTGKDFFVTGFEGDPRRSMSERRIKHSPLRDVAGMIWSFYCAAYSPISAGQDRIRSKDTAFLEPWADVWHRHAAGCFLDSYLATVAGSALLPEDRHDLETLLDIFLLDRAVYGLGMALDNHPERIFILIRGIMAVLAR